MEKYEDTQAGADSKHSRIQGTADGKKEGKDHNAAKKSLIASKMVPKGHKMLPKGPNKGMSFIGK